MNFSFTTCAYFFSSFLVSLGLFASSGNVIKLVPKDPVIEQLLQLKQVHSELGTRYASFTETLQAHLNNQKQKKELSENFRISTYFLDRRKWETNYTNLLKSSSGEEHRQKFQKIFGTDAAAFKLDFVKQGAEQAIHIFESSYKLSMSISEDFRRSGYLRTHNGMETSFSDYAMTAMSAKSMIDAFDIVYGKNGTGSNTFRFRQDFRLDELAQEVLKKNEQIKFLSKAYAILGLLETIAFESVPELITPLRNGDILEVTRILVELNKQNSKIYSTERLVQIFEVYGKTHPEIVTKFGSYVEAQVRREKFSVVSNSCSQIAR